MGLASDSDTWGNFDQLVLFELSGGALPFASSLSKQNKPRLHTFYFCPQNSDDRFVAATHFPFGQALGPCKNVTSEVIRHILARNMGEHFLVACAWPEVSEALCHNILFILSTFWKFAPATTRWILGGFTHTSAQWIHKQFGRGIIFAVKSFQACAVACHTWWFVSSMPSWPFKVLWSQNCAVPVCQHAAATDLLLANWKFAGRYFCDKLCWDTLLQMQVCCDHTAGVRPLLAVEVESLFGYGEAHTAPLLQDSAPGDSKDRTKVEDRRVQVLLQTLPQCVVNLLISQPSEHCVDLGLVSSPNFVDCTLPIQDLLLDSKLACPYTQDRQRRGLCTTSVGPDWADLHAFQAARSAGGLQRKSDGFAVSHQRLIPYGLPPNLHVLVAESVPSPFQVCVQVADDLDFAIRMVVKFGAEIRAWRQAQWRILSSFLKQTGPLLHWFDQKRTASSQRVSAHLCPGTLEALRVSISWPDHAAALGLCEGVQIVGDLPTFGIYRSASAAAQVPSNCFCSSENQKWLNEVLARPPPPHAGTNLKMNERLESWKAGLTLKSSTRGLVHMSGGQ